LQLFLNGQLMTTGGASPDYSLSGSTITFVVAATPGAGDILVASYRFGTVALIGPAANFADAQVPSGLINGVNRAYTLAQIPNPSASLILVQDGIVLTPGGSSGFTITNAAITTANPPIGDLRAWYRY
jgi:hypothetical protein